MSRWGAGRTIGERAVTIQIGAVLLLAIAFSALALYQVNAVPEQNRAVEIDHNDRVRGDLVELRDSILNTGTTGGTLGVSIELGTQYRSRYATINPSHPRGTVRTIEPGSNVTIAEPDGSEHEFETRHLVYEPDYNEYERAPRTVIEHSFVYDQFGDANVSVGAQRLVGNERISLMLLDGDLHEQAAGTASVTVESLDPVRTTTLDAGTTITLPTRSVERWEAALDETGGVSYNDTESGSSVVTIDLEDEFELEIARVGVGSGGESLGDGFAIGSERNTGGDGNGSGAYEVWFEGAAKNASECEDGEGCDYYIEAGATPRFTADAGASEASFDFAYDTAAGVTVENFSEDSNRGETEFDVEGEGTLELYVSSGGSSDTLTIDVRERKGLVVTEVDPQDPVEEGEDLLVDVVVENRGERATTQEITLDVDSEQDGTFDAVDGIEETVAPGATERVTLTYTTQTGDEPEIDVRGRTIDDDTGIVRAAEVYTIDDFLGVKIVDTDDPVTEGETMEVTVDVRQTFGADVILEVDGTEVDRTSVNENGEVTLTWDTVAGDAGTHTLTAIVSGYWSEDQDETNVTVTEPTFEVATAEITGESGGGQAGVSQVTFAYEINPGVDVAFTVYDTNGNAVSDTVTETSTGAFTEVAVDVDAGSTSPGREPRPVEAEASVVGGETCNVMIDDGDGNGPFDLCS
ncbi:hypothetical protein [Halosolutus gelatinilyticus]|uniref:COG1470 family protein n=1 Tax=Halosolutus gelatinilyticus TaxID=2931975 RepID=UPI001FF1CB28|nr:hypothetical protein [Halosolutus gelatinilyticus]